MQAAEKADKLPPALREKLLIKAAGSGFYNTGISTCIWLISNRNDPQRRGKV